MYKQDLYLRNNPDILFAKEFIRVVHGGRGDYVEFTREQIIPRLFYKFPPEVVYDEEPQYDPEYLERLENASGQELFDLAFADPLLHIITPSRKITYDNNIVEFDINRFEKYTGFYYHWLYPEDSVDTKVYFQLRTVKYADYKLFHFYVSPDLFIDFYDPRRLF